MVEIIVYYSHTGENYISGEVKNLKVGITEIAATKLQVLTGAEIFRIESAVPEPKSISEFVNQTMADLKRNARPELIRYPEHFEKYDVIYLGYPNYFGTMPAPVYSFLERTDLSEKRILPFCTHGGDGFGYSEQEIRKACFNAIVEMGPAIRDAEIMDADGIVKEWIAQRKR